jgi:hypothetical protein
LGFLIRVLNLFRISDFGFRVSELRPFRRDVAWIFGLGLLGLVIFCGSDWQPEPSFVEWAHDLREGPAKQALCWVAEHLCIFSNAGEGLMEQIKHNVRGQGVFLLGQAGPRAVWYYFPVLLTIKLSLPLLLLPLLLLVFRRRALMNWALACALALLLFSPAYRVQLGIRMILPLVALGTIGLAAALVHCCRSARHAWQRSLWTVASTTAVAWTALAALLVWPDGLCYTNELWGGTSEGYRSVSDSNYDWGQGLKELARWQQQSGRGPVDLFYFGMDPTAARLPMHSIPLFALPLKQPEDVLTYVHGHYLAVSKSLVYGAVLLGLPGRSAAISFLKERVPLVRTSTFLIYDFTGEGANCARSLPPGSLAQPVNAPSEPVPVVQ